MRVLAHPDVATGTRAVLTNLMKSRNRMRKERTNGNICCLKYNWSYFWNI